MLKNTKKRISIGLLMDSLLDDYAIKIWEGVIDTSEKEDLDLFTFVGGPLKSVYSKIDNRNHIFKMVTKNRMDGIVIIASSICGILNWQVTLDFFKQFYPLPIISIGLPVQNYHSIQIENITSFKKLLEHFINFHNYKKVAFISGLKSHYDAKIRLKIYKEVLKENKIKIDNELIVQGDFLYESGTNAVNELIDVRRKSFDAVIAANDYMAIAVMKELQRRGIKIPDEVAVAGFDNITSCYYVNPQLTTIGQLPYILGKKSVLNLISLINNENVPIKEEIPCNLLIRQSCGCNVVNNNSHDLKKNKTYDFNKINKSEFHNILKDHAEKSITNYFPKISDSDELDEIISCIISFVYNKIYNYDYQKNLIFLDDIYDFSKQKRIDLIFWNDVFFDIYNVLNDEIIFTDRYYNIVKKIFMNIKEEILKLSMKSMEEKIFNQDTFDWRSVFISRYFISILDMVKLEEVILSEYPILGITEFYLSLFERENSYDYSNLQIAYKNNSKIEIKDERYLSYDIIPEKYFDNERKHYIVMSLYFEDKHFGFIVYKYGTHMGKIYEFLTNQLSGVIKHIKLFNEINDYTKKLEDKVKERTKKLEDAYNDLKKVDNLKNDFIANITHDFRSPLTAILNIADLRIMHNEDNPAERENYEIIYDASAKLKNSIDKLLDIAKMDSQGMKLKVKLIDIISIVKMNIDFYSSTVIGSKIKVIGKYPGKPIVNLYTDIEKFEEVLNNVISNAIKFVDIDNGKILVNLVDKKDSVVLCVEDNGIGIPTDKLELIFNRFEQGHEGRDSKFKGTGIGLAYSRQIINHLHGRIWAESEGEGKGTKIFIKLKKGKDFFDEKDFNKNVNRINNEYKKKEIKQLIQSEINEQGSKNEFVTIFNKLNNENEFEYIKGIILIIDDDKNIRYIVMKYLERYGFKNFILASNGKIALDAVYEYSPDIIISDFNMPGLRGDVFHDIVSSNPKYKNIPFVFLSAIADTNIIYERKEKGASAYLQKPIDKNELIFTVEYHIKKYFEYLILVQQAMIDELTGINNRRSIMKLFKHELSIRKYRNIAIVFFDVDDFKKINDKFGHKTGDSVLKCIGKFISENIRDCDICGRYGGDEFIIIFPETSGQSALIAVEKLRKKIKDFCFINRKHGLKVTLSIGITSLFENEKYISKKLNIKSLKSIFEVKDPQKTDWNKISEYKQKLLELLLNMADAALYNAKTISCKRCRFTSIKKDDFTYNKCPECNSTQILPGKDKAVIFKPDMN